MKYLFALAISAVVLVAAEFVLGQTKDPRSSDVPVVNQVDTPAPAQHELEGLAQDPDEIVEASQLSLAGTFSIQVARLLPDGTKGPDEQLRRDLTRRLQNAIPTLPIVDKRSRPNSAMTITVSSWSDENGEYASWLLCIVERIRYTDDIAPRWFYFTSIDGTTEDQVISIFLERLVRGSERAAARHKERQSP